MAKSKKYNAPARALNRETHGAVLAGDCLMPLIFASRRGMRRADFSIIAFI
ncbi:MAG TPA: hypothetical protein VF762_06555 [Blastocatellia bacterium]|jgi:succinate dehydrogenase flavin-adding protein (antitoxin of CptAB toxin-antitoxin module)